MNTACQIFLEDENPAIYTRGDSIDGYLEVRSIIDEHFDVDISFEGVKFALFYNSRWTYAEVTLGYVRTWLSHDSSLDKDIHIVRTAEYKVRVEL